MCDSIYGDDGHCRPFGEMTMTTTTIKPLNMFHTPASWAELQDSIDQLSGPEKAVATIYAVQAWNLAAKITATPPALPDYTAKQLRELGISIMHLDHLAEMVAVIGNGESISMALAKAFLWSETPQGYVYWRELATDLDLGIPIDPPAVEYIKHLHGLYHAVNDPVPAPPVKIVMRR